MRAVAVILLLVATTALFQSRNWGWGLPPAGVAGLSLLTLGGALAGTARLIAAWQPPRRRARLRPFLLNSLAAWAALAIWFGFLLGSLPGSPGSPLQRAPLALALGWMLSPFLGLALTRLGARLR